uniref:Uncharacterized protein n=1 Tax=Meloidogyne hapla TaxID=6305 RepID=A0A1I8BAW7_MELHA
MEQQLTKLKAEMHAMEAVLERMKNTERQEDELDEEKDEEKNKENDNKDKTKIKIEKSENHKRNEGKTEIKNSVKQENQITTKIPNTPKIVLPIKVKNNKNHRHLNNPRPVPILIGDQKIIVSSASIPQISSKKSSLSVEEKKNISNYQLNQQILTTTTSKPLLFMKTSIQRRNNRGSLNNNTNINKKVILTENPGCTSGKSYESRPCTSTTEQCPTTIPPIPPSKIQIIPKKEKPSLNILRRTSLSIGPLQIEENIKKENEGQNHQRLSENEILRHRHRLMLAQRHRMLKYKN